MCLLFGPSAAGGAYIPAFCDVVVMVEGNACMYLGSPRMAEMVIGEKVTLEEMGGAKMHCSVSGCGDVLVKSEDRGHRVRQALPRVHAAELRRAAAVAPTRRARQASASAIEELVPADENKPFDMMRVIDAHRRRGQLLRDQEALRHGDHHRLRAHRRAGRGHRREPAEVAGRRAFVDCADKAARFIWLCDAFNIPLLYLADVPGFMIGTKVERQGIIRAGAKMIAAVSEATVPKISRRRAQGVRRRALRDVRPGVRARRVHRAAHGVDRGDGPGGRGQRGLLQQDPGGARRARARRLRRPSCATSTGRTSTSTSSRASWSSTRSFRAIVCGKRFPRGSFGLPVNASHVPRRNTWYRRFEGSRSPLVVGDVEPR